MRTRMTSVMLIVPSSGINNRRPTLKPSQPHRTRLKLRKVKANAASVYNKKIWTGRMLDDRNITKRRHSCSAMKSTCTLLRWRIPANLCTRRAARGIERVWRERDGVQLPNVELRNVSGSLAVLFCICLCCWLLSATFVYSDLLTLEISVVNQKPITYIISSCTIK